MLWVIRQEVLDELVLVSEPTRFAFLHSKALNKGSPFFRINQLLERVRCQIAHDVPFVIFHYTTGVNQPIKAYRPGKELIATKVKVSIGLRIVFEPSHGGENLEFRILVSSGLDH